MRRTAQTPENTVDEMRPIVDDIPDFGDALAETEPQLPPESVEETEIKGRQKHAGGAPRGPLPTPRVFDLPPEEFFRYWWSLRKHDRHKRATVYPYRAWPVCDNLQELPPEEQDRIRRLRAQKKKAGPPTNIGINNTAEPFDPSNWEQEIYHRFGAGDYHFKLNDTDPKINKTICMTMVRGLRDMDHYPPNCRPSIVVLTDPANQSYLQWARARGISFPGDPPSPAEQAQTEAEMAEQKSSEILANTLDRVVDKIQQQATAPHPQNDGTNTTLTTLMAVIDRIESRHTEDARRADERHKAEMAILEKRLSEVRESAPKPVDPLEAFTAIAGAIKNLIPASAPVPPQAPVEANPMVALLMQLRKEDAERFQREADTMQKRMDAIEARTTQAATATPGGTSEIKQFIKSAADIKTFIEDLAGDRGPEGWLGVAENLGDKVLDTVKVVSTNIAAMKTGVPPMAPAPGTPATTQPLIQAAPQPQQTQEQQQMFLENQIAVQIHPELVKALRASQPGHEFAGRLIATYGHLPQFQEIYNNLVVKGAPAVIGDRGFLRRNGQLWGELLQFNATLEQFVIEFLDAPKANQIAQAILGATRQQQAPPAAAPAPLQTVRPNGPVPVPEARPRGRTIITPDGPVQTKPPE